MSLLLKNSLLPFTRSNYTFTSIASENSNNIAIASQGTTPESAQSLWHHSQLAIASADAEFKPDSFTISCFNPSPAPTKPANQLFLKNRIAPLPTPLTDQQIIPQSAQ